jgi:hypothetical protein
LPTQSPPEQTTVDGQGTAASQSVQPVGAVTQIWTPFPEQRFEPFEHWSLQLLRQAPPEQTMPSAQVCVLSQSVHPLTSFWQVCTLSPRQRLAPAVHWSLQLLAQSPPEQSSPAGQAVTADHAPQPERFSQIRKPPPSQVRAPTVQTLLQVAGGGSVGGGSVGGGSSTGGSWSVGSPPQPRNGLEIKVSKKRRLRTRMGRSFHPWMPLGARSRTENDTISAWLWRVAARAWRAGSRILMQLFSGRAASPGGSELAVHGLGELYGDRAPAAVRGSRGRSAGRAPPR